MTGSASDRPPVDPLPVIACALSALTEDQKRRRDALAEALRAIVLAVSELPSGYALDLARDPSIQFQVDELIALERLCCPFLTLASHIDVPSDRIVLELTGGLGVKAFIADQFVASPLRKESP